MKNSIHVTLLAAVLYALTASPSSAQPCTVKPAVISLGQTVRLSCRVPAARAKLNDRTVRLFPQPNGSSQGLMPIAVADTPGAYQIEFLAEDDKSLASAKLTIRPTKFPTQNVVLAPQIEALHSTPEDMKMLTEFRNTVSEVKYWDDALTAPVPGCILSPFGVKRLHNGKPTGEIHSGIDQRSPAGRPVHAVAGGTVKIAQPFAVLGGTVAIDHGQGLETMYLHMSKLLVEPGAQVKKGEVIGYVGATGRANGPHLHWVVDVNGVPVNPQQWVALKTCGSEKAKPTRNSSEVLTNMDPALSKMVAICPVAAAACGSQPPTPTGQACDAQRPATHQSAPETTPQVEMKFRPVKMSEGIYEEWFQV